MAQFEEPKEIYLNFKLSYEALNADIPTTEQLLLDIIHPLKPNTIRIRSYSATTYCYLSFLVNVAQVNISLNVLMNTFIQKYPALQEVGTGFSFWDFEIFIEYAVCLNVYIQSENIGLLKKFHFVFKKDVKTTSISTNSRQTNDLAYKMLGSQNEEEADEYDQLFFYLPSDIAARKQLIQQWKDTYPTKYAAYQHWGYDKKSSSLETSPYIVLTVKVAIGEGLFEWDELDKDLLNFIKSLNPFFVKYPTKIAWGRYHCRYDGGEIGHTQLLPLIDLGIDVQLTRSILAPQNAYASINL